MAKEALPYIANVFTIIIGIITILTVIGLIQKGDAPSKEPANRIDTVVVIKEGEPPKEGTSPKVIDLKKPIRVPKPPPVSKPEIPDEIKATPVVTDFETVIRQKLSKINAADQAAFLKTLAAADSLTLKERAIVKKLQTMRKVKVREHGK